ncbi:hypothetical protein [Candidatus Bealeia paramacronuclearis]
MEKKSQFLFTYAYKTINPDRTRFFFEGEALIIDPTNTQFDSYVTSPLLPCMLGRILDPQTGKSLVFHKSRSQKLESLTPSYNKLGTTNPSALDVELYSCEISSEKFKSYAESSGKKTQAQEIMDVRNWLRDTWKIPQNNIAVRFFRSEQYLNLPDLGKYENCPITVGVTKTGELFHTSLFDGDVFGLGQLSLPRKFKNKGSFGNLKLRDQQIIVLSLTTRVLYPTIIDIFVKSQNDTKEIRDTKNFFVTDKLDLPSSSLAKFFNVVLGDEKIDGDIPSKLKNN